MSKRFLYVFVFIILSASSIAQTPLVGTFATDTVLLSSLSPYLISSSISITSGATFDVEPGTIIYLDNSMSIIVNNGTLNLNGGINDSIQLINNNTQWSRISGQDANINISYCVFKNASQILSANNGEVRIDNSRFDSITGGDAVAIHYSDTVIVHNCNFEGVKNTAKIDCIDCDGISYGLFYNNRFTNWNDDAIDIGVSATNIIICNNYFENCDYAVSLGESSVAEIYRNLMIRNKGGLQSHTGAIMTAYNNTIYNAIFGIQCFHGGTANTGGTAYLRNIIFSKSKYADFQVQTSSLLEITYSSSDIDTLQGTGNIFGYPQFVDTLNNDFHLLAGSICIDSGDPADPLDTNGNFIDIGAFEYYDTTTVYNEVFKNIDINLYPNPTVGIFIIKGHDIKSIEIIDITGKPLKNIQCCHNLEGFKIDLSNNPKGIYFIRLAKEDCVIFKKVILN